MKIRGASVLVGCAVLLLMAAPPIHAQRGGGGRMQGGGGTGGAGGGGRGGYGGGGRPVNPPARVTTTTPRVTTTTIPSSPIQPITNPVPPIVPTDGTAGTTRIVPVNTVRNNVGRRGNVIVVGGGFWPGYFPFSDGWYPQPYLEPAPVPGELPGTYRYQQPPYDPPPAYYTQADPAPAPLVEPEPAFAPDQHIIVTLPEPDRVVVPPAIGTS